MHDAICDPRGPGRPSPAVVALEGEVWAIATGWGLLGHQDAAR